jgi:hypothetical protein
MNDDLIESPPTTALESSLVRPRPNHWLLGVLAFLAVVGIGAGVTVVLRPPVHLRVITVEKQVLVPQPPPAAPAATPQVVARPVPAPIRNPRRPPPSKPAAKPLNPADCHDLLCGIDERSQ